MRRMTASGSLYGGIQVFAKQKRKKAPNGIIPQYDVVGRLRLNPSRKRPNLRVGATDVVGRGNNRSLILAVRNTGNTLDPVGGTVRITGPTRAQRHDPAGRRRARARSSTSRAARCAACERGNYTRQLDGHAGRPSASRSSATSGSEQVRRAPSSP